MSPAPFGSLVVLYAPTKSESRKGSPLIQGGAGENSELLLRLLFYSAPQQTC